MPKRRGQARITAKHQARQYLTRYLTHYLNLSDSMSVARTLALHPKSVRVIVSRALDQTNGPGPKPRVASPCRCCQNS